MKDEKRVSTTRKVVNVVAKDWAKRLNKVGGVPARTELAAGDVNTQKRLLALAQNRGIKLLYGDEYEVTREDAFQVVPFVSGYTIIGNKLSVMEINLRGKDADGNDTVITEHPVVDLLKMPIKTRRSTTTSDFLKSIVSNLLIHGNAYVEISRVRSRVDSLVPISSTRVRPEILDTEAVIYHVKPKPGNPTGETRPLTERDIIHFHREPLIDGEGVEGESPLVLLRQPIITSLELDRHVRRGMRGGNQKAFLMDDSPDMPQDTFDNLSESLNDPDQDGRIGVLDAGRKIVWGPTSSNVESQIIELMRTVTSKMSAHFQIPMNVLGDTASVTALGTGLAVQNQSFMQNALAPYSHNIEQSLTNALLTQREIDAGMYIKFNFDELLRGTTAERLSLWQGLYNMNAATPAEIRERAGFDRRDDVIPDVPMGSGVREPDPGTTPTQTPTPPKPPVDPTGVN